MTKNMKETNLRAIYGRFGMGVLTVLALSVTTHLAHAESVHLDGIWRIEKPVVAVRTIDGKVPPLTPEAAKVYAEHQSSRKAGDTFFDGATWCASVGMPRILLVDYPFQLVVRDPYVAFLHQWNWWARVVYLEGALPNNAAAAAGGSPQTDGGTGPGAPPGREPLLRGRR